MEYTRSKGDEFETFEGTPEEITKLINAIGKEVPKPDGEKSMKIAATPLIPVCTPLVDNARVVEEVLKSITNDLRARTRTQD